jgi:hypothetical protein
MKSVICKIVRLMCVTGRGDGEGVHLDVRLGACQVDKMRRDLTYKTVLRVFGS